jgi:hypothetical protein
LSIAPELDRFYTEAHITWLSQYGERLVIEVTRFTERKKCSIL